MSDPLFPGTVGTSIAPDWPVNEPAKTPPPQLRYCAPGGKPAATVSTTISATTAFVAKKDY
ncbi:hypothetical protein [Endozoicomonas sp. GU-1]|uniref:hypothetical protein n=1 Tax=Endozoicomonas sp. GU-1 TaxID=3009078 RepID=UPI0022B3379C|nr:hypothetical protein [Endozoicomonas sp. GU-1]WBA82232.1 hypothetical protein O2T12_03470 [Endozoicomonas sp. GU-1]